MALGIKFRGNLKQNLSPHHEGEILHAADTNEWGLVFSNNGALDIIWRQNESTQHIFSGDDTPNLDVGQNYDYYIDNTSNILYRKNGHWAQVEYPAGLAFFTKFLPIPGIADYTKTLRTDGSVLIDGVTTLPNEVSTYEYLLSRSTISSDGDRKFLDNMVTDKFGAIFRNANVVPAVERSVEWEEYVGSRSGMGGLEIVVKNSDDATVFHNDQWLRKELKFDILVTTPERPKLKGVQGGEIDIIDNCDGTYSLQSSDDITHFQIVGADYIYQESQ